MTTITIVKDERGKLVGCTDADKRAWARFRKFIDSLCIGEFFELDYWFPRNGAFHRLHFAMLNAIFDAQEQFDDIHDLRLWLQVGAGHAKFVPGADGEIIAIPKSISYRSMDDEQFRDHHERVKTFLRGEHAQWFLWRHLTTGGRRAMVETILDQFEKDAAQERANASQPSPA